MPPLSSSQTSPEGRALDRTFVVCALLALATIWLFRYPAGVDLPQHANILRILADFGDPHLGYGAFYERQLLTPYLVTYLLALPFAKLFGALAAVKILLSIAAIATPRTMIQWLRSLGGEPWWGLFGFPLTFGFAYQWGLFSFMLATPLMFAFLLADRRVAERLTARAAGSAAAWAVVLCFCHGVTFVVAAMIIGIEALVDLARTRRFRAFALRLGPCIAGAAVLAAWQLRPGIPGMGQITEWPPNNDRFVAFLSGEFVGWASYWPALAGAMILIVMTLVSRPVLAWSPDRLIPLGVGLAHYLLLPEMIGPTWLVGMRMVMFVHAFGAGAFDPGLPGPPGRGRRVMRGVTAAIVMACLVVQGIRMAIFNHELRGLTALIDAIPRGVDVQELVVDTGPNSEAFGRGAIGQVTGWVTAANGGFLSNDSGGYFQLPIRRPPGRPWVGEYHWFVARGASDIPMRVASRVGAVDVVKHAADWWLFTSKTPPRVQGGLEVVRYAQGWGGLSVDRSLSGGALRAAGQTFTHGLATHALSKIQVRAPSVGPGGHLRGAVAVDDDAGGPTELVFEILVPGGKRLWTSPPLGPGHPAVPFDVPLQGRSDAILAVEMAPKITDNRNAHADWLDLRVEN